MNGGSLQQSDEDTQSEYQVSRAENVVAEGCRKRCKLNFGPSTSEENDKKPEILMVA